MHYVIDDMYLEEAVRLRDRYFINLNTLLENENFLKSYKTKIDSLLSTVTDISSMEKQMFEIEVNINRIEKVISPIREEMKNIENQADRLYENIITKYPGIEIDEIKKQIMHKL